ncbi:hypothetical protein EJB05_01833 [Eragrostis curvula]|uniref:PHD-type domain-containing protein n=1 Tax=Eragrostis curvula TaxID=38414 RepID=A0A5J9WQR7_9POAL|nr:hypothetical protein EJB05_01833 [Eragrostis curvula]
MLVGGLDVEDNMICSEDSSSEVVDVGHVKVCDICGDLGEEEKLAICTRCNDGAEHIYCMQVMIEDVPEGDWFCEKCRAEVDTEKKHNKKPEISQVKDGTLPLKKKAEFEHMGVMNEGIKKQREAKICKICGDVGEEEKLAICSRCNDGAEHIYCMRVMIEEVPDVGWLCEMCQNEVEGEKRAEKLRKSEVKNGICKEQPTKGKLSKPANDANIRSSYENEMDVKYVDGKESQEGNLDEPAGGLSTEANSRKRVLLCGSSLKSDTEIGNHATGQVSTSLAQPRHGQLSKFVFSNSKIPKVIQLGCEVTVRPKLLKKSLSCITKQVGPMSILTSSTSFRKPNFGDQAPTVMTPMNLLAEERRVMNQPDSRNVKSNRGSSIAYPFVGESLVAPVSSLAESTGLFERNKPHLAKAPGSIMLSTSERSTGILGSDAKRMAVQVSYQSHQAYTSNNPYPKLKDEGYYTACLIGRTLDSPTMSSDLGDKTQVFTSQYFAPGYELIASAAPKMDYVWQGSFELWGTGRLPAFCDGLQAHISCSASSEVLEVAKRLPSKIQLQKLPRQSVWLPEFQENYPTCGSIDIFFFARDMKSYENYYSKLVENIMKDDLALRGNTEAAELIIFSSSTLSKNFQRWNMFYFWWGVLRVNTEKKYEPSTWPTCMDQ